MIRYILNHFIRTVLSDKRGIAWWLPAAVGAGSSLLGGLFGGGDDDEEQKSVNVTAPLPDYPEAEGARQLWWEKLQDFGDQPGFGAIAPNWADIWDMAKRRVSDYFRGTATTPGALQRVKASAARRNVSDSPALQTNIAALGAEEGRQMQDLATQQATTEAAFSEQGRQSWLDNLSRLTQLRPQYTTTEQTVTNSGGGAGAGDLVSSIGGLVGNALSAKQQQDWLSSLVKT